MSLLDFQTAMASLARDASALNSLGALLKKFELSASERAALESLVGEFSQFARFPTARPLRTLS